MTNMLEELWYGNIDPNGRAYQRKNTSNAVFDKIERADNNICAILTEEQLEHFVKYKSEMEDIIATCEEEAFKDGYKIATRLFLSCFDKAEHIFDDIM